jgi:hypothetical protein
MPAPPPRLDWLAGLLSYLLPGLGQVLQGRVGKGLLFFVCLYGLFFYGLWLGQMRNVWLPDARKLPPVSVIVTRLDGDGPVGGVAKALAYRPQFLAQFWMGVAAWPAILQYAAADPDAEPGTPRPPAAFLGFYMQAPGEDKLNELQRAGDKRWDLGWVYTVIAGVLNLLVIADAVAGPAVRDEDESATGGAG